MGFIIRIVWMVVAYFVSRAAAPKPVKPKPAAFDDFDFPQFEEGTPQEVIFGDCWTESWMVQALGNYRTTPIKRRSSGFLGIGGSSQTVGHRYYFGIHMGVNLLESDEITIVKVGDRDAWTGSITSSGTVLIQQPELFGGDDSEGGIVGRLDVMMGEPTQAVNPRLQTMVGGGLIPAFRGRTTLFYDGQISSNSPYPKTWAVRRNRIQKGWDGAAWFPEKAKLVYNDTPPEAYPAEPLESDYPNTIAGKVGFVIAHAAWVKQVAALDRERIKAMNGAHILYQTLTHRAYGRGLPASRLNAAAWSAAASTLYSERFGLCLRWTRQDSISNFVDSVLDHIGGVLYDDPTDGTIGLRLIRGDYDPEMLPTFTFGTGLLAIEDDDSSSQSAGTNEIIVEFKRPQDNSVGRARAQNKPSIARFGRLSQTVRYPGIPTYELAQRAAQRDLLAASGFLKRFKVRLDRRGSQIQKGQCFRITEPRKGITNMVLRAGRIEEGEAGKGQITISAVQDAFSLPATPNVGTPVNLWVPPDNTPQPIATRRLMEAPYWMLVTMIDQANLALIDDLAGHLLVLAMRPTGLSLDYDITTRIGASGPYTTRDVGSFTPTGTLLAALSITGTSATVAGGVDLDILSTPTIALIDDEFVRIDALNASTGAITFVRGCLDTVPAAHDSGARIWFFGDHYGADPTSYTTGNAVYAQLLTNTSQGKLSASLAGSNNITMDQRHFRPYPPGKLRVNGSSYPTSITGDLVVSWVHRDRLAQANQLVDSEQASIGPEAGTTYTLRIYSGTTLKRTVTGLTGTSYTYLNATEVTDGGPFDPIRFTLHAVRDGLESAQGHDWQVTRS